VGDIQVGVGAAASPVPEPCPVDPALSPEVKSTQLEHLLELQQKLASQRPGPVCTSAEHLAFNALDQEVAELIDHLCTHHISELGSPWHIR
jgi:hypothetical protein